MCVRACVQACVYECEEGRRRKEGDIITGVIARLCSAREGGEERKRHHEERRIRQEKRRCDGLCAVIICICICVYARKCLLHERICGRAHVSVKMREGGRGRVVR